MRSTFVCARSKLSPLVHKPTSSPPSLWHYRSSTGWSCAPQDQKICLRRIQREPSRYLITRPSRWSAPAKSARYRSPTPANSLLPQRLSQVPKFGHHSAEIRRRSPGLSAAKSEKAFGAPSGFRGRPQREPCPIPPHPAGAAHSGFAHSTDSIEIRSRQLCRNVAQTPLSRPCRRERPYFGSRLRVRELAQLDLHASCNGGHLIASLKAGEIRPVLPRPGTAQSHARLDGGVMDNVDLPFVIRIALLVATKIPEIAARSKNRVYARNLGDLVGVLQSFKGFDHQDQHHIVIDGVAVAARHIPPHIRIESSPAAETALTQRRKVSPVSCRHRLFHGIYRWDYNDQCSSVERVLDLKLIRIRHAHSRDGLRVWTGPPRLPNLVPGVVRVLHLGPDEVVSSIRHGAISARIDAGRYSTTH